MFKIGLETESCHLSMQNGRMDIFGFIDFAHEVGYEAVMLNIIEKKNLTEGLGAIGKDNPEHLAKIAEKIKEYNMPVEIDTRGTTYEHLSYVLEIAHSLGAEVVRTFITATSGYGHGNLVCAYTQEDLENAKKDVYAILPLLQKYRIRLAFENHEVETMTELMEFIDEIDSPWIGIHFDIGNTIPAWEEPVEGAKICARKTFATHIKDCIVTEIDGKYYSIGTELGKGSIDIKKGCEILLDESPLEALYIEMSNPYATEFKREPGAGGVYKVGEGTFELKNPPYPVDKLHPLDYYLHDGEFLEEMIEKQLEEVKASYKFMAEFREEYNKKKLGGI